MENKQSYFISYSHGQGFGNVEWKSDADIKNIEDVKQIAKEIGEFNNLKGIVILNIIPFPISTL